MKRSAPDQGEPSIVDELTNPANRTIYRLPDQQDTFGAAGEPLPDNVLTDDQIEEIMLMDDGDFMGIKNRFNKEEWR